MNMPPAVCHTAGIKEIALVTLILGLALALRLYGLGDENFWIDEVAYVQDSSVSPSEILTFDTSTRKTVRHVTPLPHILTHFFIRPESIERSARLPSAIFGSLEVLVLFVLARQLFSFRVGVLAAGFLALSPLHIWYSQEARWYAQWSFTTSCSYLALLYVYRNDRLRSWILYAVASLLNVYTFLYSCLVIASQAVGTMLNPRLSDRPNRTLVRFVAVQALVASAALPILWLILHRLGNSSGTERTAGIGDLPYTFYSFAAGFSAGPTLTELHSLPSVLNVLINYPIVILFLAIYFPALVLGLRKMIESPLASSLVLPWLFGLPLLVFGIAAATNLTYQVRYTLPSLSAFVLVLSYGISSIPSRAVQGGLIGGILLCSALSMSNFYWNSRYDKEHVKAALTQIRLRSAGKSPVLSVGQSEEVVKFYAAGLPIVTTPNDRCDAPVLKELSIYNSNTIWVIAARDWSNIARGCFEKLKPSYSVIDTLRFTGTDVWLLRRRKV